MKTFAGMLGWLAPPRPESRALAARVSLLYGILLADFLGAGLCALTFPFFFDRWVQALVVNSTISLAAVPLLVALHRGHVDLVGRATAWLGAFAVVLSIVNSGGIRSPALLAFPAALMITGFVSTRRRLASVTLLLVAVLFFVGIGEDAGLLEGVKTPPSGTELFLSFSMSLLATAVVIHVSLRTIGVALESAEESERRLAELIERNPDGIVAVDLEGRIRSANRAARTLFGLPDGTLPSEPLHAAPALSADSADRLRDALVFADESETGELMLDLASTSSSAVFVRARIRRVRAGAEGVGCQITLRDETDRVAAERQREKLEEALVQAQKMQIVGQLAGGVAHDFNNYLSVIRTCADTLRAKLPKDLKTAPLLDAIAEASERSSELTRQLLAFSRKQVMQPRVVELAELVGATVPMLRRTLPPRIALRVASASGPTTVFADPSQLEVALLNLVVNARDAMPAGGELFVETALVSVDEETRTMRGFESGQAIALEVRDTGQGMDEETRARACEPFFTTKGTGGTGLGLSSVDGIVEQSGGRLRLESKKGEGTKVRIFLPRVEGESSRVRAPDLAPARGGTETILLVEDQPLLRSITEDMLVGEGYRVLVAESAERAYELFQEAPLAIDLVISDVVLPGADGLDLADRFRLQRPELPVLLVSGFTPTRRDITDVDGTPYPFLQKPFTARALLHRARNLLDGTNDPAVSTVA